MARGKKTEEKKELDYIEYDINGANGNDMEGRVYKEPHIVEGKGSWHGMSFTFNGLSVKGCKLWIPVDEKKAVCILWPSYEDKEKKKQSYIAFFKKEDREDVANLCEHLAGQLGY